MSTPPSSETPLSTDQPRPAVWSEKFEGNFWPGAGRGQWNEGSKTSYACKGTLYRDEDDNLHPDSVFTVDGQEGKAIHPRTPAMEPIFDKRDRMEFDYGYPEVWMQDTDVAGRETGDKGDQESVGGHTTGDRDQKETVKGGKVPSMTV
jgi:hypothetical protein